MYFVLIGRKYGNSMKNGKSATETEFDTAIKENKHAYAFVRNDSWEDQDPKESKFLKKIQQKLT